MKQITLHENMTLQEYLTYVREQPVLSTQEVRSMLDVVRNGGAKAQETYRQLVDAHLFIVVSVAKTYQNHGLDLVELINAGNRGLLCALDRFSDSNRFKFVPYSVYWIRQYILVAIAENNGIAAAVQSGQTDNKEFKALLDTFPESDQKRLNLIYDLL
jgi:RNA polymerase primary sigma factor